MNLNEARILLPASVYTTNFTENPSALFPEGSRFFNTFMIY